MADDLEPQPQVVTDDFTDLYRATYDDGLNGQVLNATFASTGAAAASADGTTNEWHGDGTFVPLAGGVDADGTNSDFRAGAFFVTDPGGTNAQGTGFPFIVNQADATFRFAAGAAPADGYNVAFYTETPTLEGETFSVTYTSVLVSQDPFRKPNLEVKSGVAIKFSIGDWRIREGIPLTEATYRCVQEIEASIGTAEPDDPFLGQEEVGMISEFRWLANGYIPGNNWTPIGSAPGPGANRTWDEVSEQFSWYSAALRSWDQLMVDYADSSIPQWVQAGTDNPVKSTTYSYWRVDQYVTCTGLLCNPDVSMDLFWTPPPEAALAPVTIVVVLVPRVPISGSFTVLATGPNISLVLNDNSTVDLMLGPERITLDTVGSRVRSNEPIVLALQVLPSERKVMTAVMDSMIRTSTTQVSGSVAIDPSDWRIGIGDLSAFEILEVDMYRTHMSERQLASVLSVFDRIYGVTM